MLISIAGNTATLALTFEKSSVMASWHVHNAIINLHTDNYRKERKRKTVYIDRPILPVPSLAFRHCSEAVPTTAFSTATEIPGHEHKQAPQPVSPERQAASESMERRWRRGCCLLTVALVAAMVSAEAKLSPGYYRTTCPRVESIVRSAVARKVRETFVTVPATLRLFFHDCFVQGCDASVMIASGSNDAEKDAPDNESLAGDGFDTVVRAKAAVEKACPGVVSCADVLALAARDVVSMSSGPRWTVELGRLDGLVSKAGDVAGRLPGPDMQPDALAAMFADNNLTVPDMVALSGAHTVGFSHCARFAGRLYRSGSGGADPSYYRASYARQLKAACPQDVGPTIAVDMDPVTPTVFDNAYYANLARGLGLFASDQALHDGAASRPAVEGFARNQSLFFEAFKEAMVKLGRVGVKSGRSGEIRRDCTAFNR